MVEDGDVVTRKCRLWFWQTFFYELINRQIIKRNMLKAAEFIEFLHK
jgi:hypothetical protein